METNNAFGNEFTRYPTVTFENYDSFEETTLAERKIAGSLKAFNLINWVVLVSASVAVLVLCGVTAAFYVSNKPYLELIGMATQLMPVILLSSGCISVLRQQEVYVPDEINKYLTAFVGASVLIYGILYYAANAGFLADKPITVIGCILYYIVCSSYFKRSESVKRYFGSNATP